MKYPDFSFSTVIANWKERLCKISPSESFFLFGGEKHGNRVLTLAKISLKWVMFSRLFVCDAHTHKTTYTTTFHDSNSTISMIFFLILPHCSLLHFTSSKLTFFPLLLPHQLFYDYGCNGISIRQADTAYQTQMAPLISFEPNAFYFSTLLFFLFYLFNLT